MLHFQRNHTAMQETVAMLLMVLSTLTSVPPVYAHNAGSGSEIVVDEHVLELVVEPEHPLADEGTLLHLDIRDSAGESVNADMLWVRISHGRDVLFSGTLSPEPSGTEFTYTFPEKATYDVKIRYTLNATKTVEGVFPILVSGDSTVSPSTLDDKSDNRGPIMALVAVALAIIVYFNTMRKREKEDA